jgi:hypothetical protein
LDYKRLGKQRVEAKQILNILLGRAKPSKNGKIPWSNHPAVLMWMGYEECLKIYHNIMIAEWIRRGYNNTMQLETPSSDVEYPQWMGDNRLHFSHRSRLLQKDREYYSRFDWEVSEDLEYFWPTKEGYHDRCRPVCVSNDTATN